MRRLFVLAALVLMLMAARPSSAQSPSTDERLDVLEAQVFQIADMLASFQFPAPLTISDNRDTGDILNAGGLLFWAGELPPERTFYLWCKPFNATGFGSGTGNEIGLECGWTPGP